MTRLADQYYGQDFKIAMATIIMEAARLRSFQFLSNDDVIANGNKEHDQRAALLCSLVSALAEELQIEPPEWSSAPRWLPEPYFPSGLMSIRPWLLAESPPHFRRNNIFVSSDILKRV